MSNGKKQQKIDGLTKTSHLKHVCMKTTKPQTRLQNMYAPMPPTLPFKPQQQYLTQE